MKIQARFTATPINAFAPAIVHLDASATTAEGVARPFHELEFRWYVARAGSFVTDLVVSDSPMAAVVLDEPGEYAVILRAAAPDGSAAHVFQRLTITAPTRVIELERGSRVSAPALPAGGGLLRTRPGDGESARITGSLSPQDGWTIADVILEGGGVVLAPERSGISLVDVVAEASRDGCLVSQTGGGRFHSERIGVARCFLEAASTSRTPAVFLRASRIIVYESTILGSGTYPLRMVHFDRMVLSRSTIAATVQGVNALQLRAWAGAGPPVGPPAAPSERWAVVDCSLVATNPSGALVRTCQTQTCDDSGSGVATASDVRDGICRRLDMFVNGTAAPPPAIGFWLQGGDITIEDCYLVAPQVSMVGPGTVRFVQQRPDSARRAGLAHDRIQVRRARARLPAGPRGVVLLEAPVGVGHEVDGAVERTP